MQDFTREQYNFDPIPFYLVSNQDHITPILGAGANSYNISMNYDKFIQGSGVIHEVGQGWYELFFDHSELIPGPVLVSIPKSGVSTNFDPIRFRVNCVPVIEIVPGSQYSLYTMTFLMISSQDHMSSVLKVNPVVEISMDGSPFETVTNSPPAEIGLGFYKIALSTFGDVPISDFNNEGIYTIKATAPGADVTYDSFQVYRYLYPA